MATVRELSDLNPDGTRLGQTAADKIGFYGLTTPIIQPVHIADATDAATAITQINLVLAALESLGLLATS